MTGMSTNAPLVTIFGGSGFVGRYIARRMAKAGWRVRVATRRPNEALFVQTYGVVGQVVPVLANIRYEQSVREAVRGADAVVNCVGVLEEGGRQTFEALHAEGAATIAKCAVEEGASALVHISSIGADPEAPSKYLRTKAEGEKRVREAFPDAVILRPSIIFGTEDEFFNRFASMAKLTPVLPIFGEDTKMQPIYVDNVAEAVEHVLLNGAASGVYELGGPEVATFGELIERTLGVIGRRRWVIDLPWWIARINGGIFGFFSKLSGGLIPAPFTRDQVESMTVDNVVGERARTLSDLGVDATPMDSILESYLYCYRPSGQYAEITASAKNLRTQE
jgi:uncharacterized protein YbjT (DUF2867 family)